MSDMKNDKICLVCKSTKIKVIPYIDLPFYGKDIIDFSKLQLCYCEVCGFGYSAPEISRDVVDKFYSEIQQIGGNKLDTSSLLKRLIS